MACRPLGGYQPMPGENDRVTDPNWDSGKMERSINPYPTGGSMEPPPSIGHRSGRDQPGCQFAKGYPSWEVFLVLPIFQNLAVLSLHSPSQNRSRDPSWPGVLLSDIPRHHEGAGSDLRWCLPSLLGTA